MELNFRLIAFRDLVPKRFAGPNAPDMIKLDWFTKNLEPGKKFIGLPFRMNRSKQPQAERVVISRCRNRIRQNRYVSKKRKNFCVYSMPGKQLGVNHIACMYNPARQTLYEGFNDLSLTKAKDLCLKRSAYLRSNPKLVQHQMRRRLPYNRLRNFGQRKAQT